MHKVFFSIMALSLFAGATFTKVSYAGIWTQPTAELDEFRSVGVKILDLLPAWTGFPAPIRAEFRGEGNNFVGRNTQVVRDPLVSDIPGVPNPAAPGPFVQDGLDTINTEIVDFLLVGEALVGNVFGFHTEIQAGFGNSFFVGGVGLDHTRGQIQDLAGVPDGSIDFPADSFFDVFFDIWVDLDNDLIADVGEVLSNDIRNAIGDPDVLSYALRMAQPLLEGPSPNGRFPRQGTEYTSIGKVWALDPEIGTFQATVLGLPLDLYPILPDRQAVGPAHAQVVNAIHRVPEPAIFALLAPGVALFGLRRRRQKAAS